MTNNLLFIDPALEGKVLGIVVLSLFALIAVGIILYRMFLSKTAESGELSGMQRVSKSPLDGRNKYPEVDVLRKSGTIWNIGMITALALGILTFSWTNYTKERTYDRDLLLVDEDIEQEPPRTAEPPPPPPPPPPPVIEEVPEELIEEEDEPVFEDMDIDADEEIDEREEEEEVEEEEEPEVEEPVEEEPEEEIFKVVEDMPRFPGCEGKGMNKEDLKKCSDQKMLDFIYSNIKYPPVARENNIEGKVYIQFVVEKSGAIADIKVVKSPSGALDKESLRVVKKMNSMSEKWIPGRQRGKPVKVRYTLPIKFSLQN